MPTPTSNGALTNKGLICFSSAVHRWMLAIFVFSWLQAAMGLCEPSFSFHESWFWCPSFSPFFWLPLNFHCLVYFSLFSCGDQTTSKASQTQVTDVFFVFFVNWLSTMQQTSFCQVQDDWKPDVMVFVNSAREAPSLVDLVGHLFHPAQCSWEHIHNRIQTNLT